MRCRGGAEEEEEQPPQQDEEEEDSNREKEEESPANDTEAPESDTPGSSCSSSVLEEPNPLWPAGATNEAIEDLIDVVLHDTQLNIRGIPDPLERQIYKSTIQLSLDALYEVLGSVHGQEILGHFVRATREFRFPSHAAARKELTARMEALGFERDVEEDVLETIADRMLSNHQTNVRWLPDPIERALYVNCLKIVFRLFNLFSASLVVTLCGHDLTLKIEPSTRYFALRDAALRRSEAMAEGGAAEETSPGGTTSLALSVDLDQLLEIAKEEARNQPPPGLWFWQRWWTPAYQDLQAKLHVTMYSLVLGILDDLLDHTEIQILFDTIKFDMVNGPARDKGGPKDETPWVPVVVPPPRRRHRSLLSTAFWVGTGVGLGLSLQKAVALPAGFPVLEAGAFSGLLRRLDPQEGPWLRSLATAARKLLGKPPAAPEEEEEDAEETGGGAPFWRTILRRREATE